MAERGTMTRPEAAAGGEISIPICPGQRRARAPAQRERRLNWFVCFVAFGEWAGNAFGTLAFLWATVVLLGGFCTALNQEDFWFATVMIFIEAFRMFSSNYKLDHQSLFGTTRAVKFIRSIGLMFVRPQEWNEVVAIIGLFFSLIMQFPSGGLPTLLLGVATIFASKMQFPGAIQLMSRLRQHQRLLLWALLVALLLLTGLQIHRSIHIYRDRHGTRHRATRVYTLTWPFDRMGNMLVDLLLWCLFQLVLVLAVLLLNLRPPRITNLTSSPCGRKLLSSAKLVSALCLVGDMLFVHNPFRGFSISFIILALSLGSLQTPVDSTLFGRWANIFLYICFLAGLVLTSSPGMMIVIIMLTVILVGNLQIPAAVARTVLSSLRLSDLSALKVYPQGKDSNRNLVPSIKVFYVMALCQGTLYLMACIVELFAFFPRRSLVRYSRFRGQWGARAVYVYYQRAYITCMETGVLAAGRTLSLASFSIESLSSTSRDMQIVGVSVLHALLQQRNFSEELLLKIIGSGKVLRTLVGMLGWTSQQDRDIRLFAARVISELAGCLRLASIPSMLKLVSSLLDAENQPAWHHHQQDFLSHPVSINGQNVVDNQSSGQQSSAQPALGNGGNADNQTTQGEGNNGGCSWLCRCWQRMKEKHWFIPQDPPLTHQDSFPVLGMLILERLAYDIDNCTEIGRATDLIFKITEFISYNTDTAGDDNAPQKAVICSSLNLIRRLSITEGKIRHYAPARAVGEPLLAEQPRRYLGGQPKRSSDMEAGGRYRSHVCLG